LSKTPKVLHPITCYDEDTDSFAMPDDVAAVPVVICTLVTAARLVDKGLPRGHFAYILVDEAAQAKEAETVVPLALLDPAAGGRLILGGDPCQLGPVVASNVAKEHGLEVSLMERLMRDFPRYRPGAGSAASGTAFDPAAIVRLVANYRSHGALLTVPSVLFYGGELLERANRSETGALPYGNRCAIKPRYRGFPTGQQGSGRVLVGSLGPDSARWLLGCLHEF